MELRVSQAKPVFNPQRALSRELSNAALAALDPSLEGRARSMSCGPRGASLCLVGPLSHDGRLGRGYFMSASVYFMSASTRASPCQALPTTPTPLSPTRSARLVGNAPTPSKRRPWRVGDGARGRQAWGARQAFRRCQSRRVLASFAVGTFGALGSSALDSPKRIITRYARRICPPHPAASRIVRGRGG